MKRKLFISNKRRSKAAITISQKNTRKQNHKADQTRKARNKTELKKDRNNNSGRRPEENRGSDKE